MAKKQSLLVYKVTLKFVSGACHFGGYTPWCLYIILSSMADFVKIKNFYESVNVVSVSGELKLIFRKYSTPISLLFGFYKLGHLQSKNKF